MFIQVSLHRLTKTELDVWIDASISLVLGQVLRFDTDSPLYAQLVSMEGGLREGFWLAKLQVILGTPISPLDSATVLNDEELAREIHFFRGGEEYSVQLGRHFSSDLSELGTITLIESPSVALKQQVLNIALHEIQAFQKQVLLDPVGLFASQAGPETRLTAGKDFRLSIQKVGILKFLKVLGEEFPPALQEEALRILSKVVPATPDFIPLRHFLRPEKLPDLPVKTPLLHGLYDIYQQKVFADTPEEVFSLVDHLSDQVTSLDFSGIQEPWRSLMYEEICREILEQVAGQAHSNIVFTLVYPESYLSNLEQWIRKAYEAGLNLLIVPASYEAPTLHSMANNFLRVDSDGWAVLQGSNTLGFPLKFKVRELTQKKSASGFFQEGTEEFHYQEFSMPPAEAKSPEAQSHEVKTPEVKNIEIKAPEPVIPVEALPTYGMEAAIAPGPTFSSAKSSVSQPAPTPLPHESVSVWSQQPEETFTPQPVHEEAPVTSIMLPEEAITYLPVEPVSATVEPPALEPADTHAHDVKDEDHEDEDDIFGKSTDSKSHESAPAVKPPPATGSGGLDFSSDMFEEDDDFETPPAPSLTVKGSSDSMFDGLDIEEDVLHEEASSGETGDFSFDMTHPVLENPVESHSPLAHDTEIQKPAVPGTLTAEAPPPHSEPEPPIQPLIPAEPEPKIEIEETEEESEEESDEPMQETIPVYRVQEEPAAYRENERIRHEKYGLGVINKVHPDAMDGRILLTVIFEAVGKRIIDPALSHIEKA